MLYTGHMAFQPLQKGQPKGTSADKAKAIAAAAGAKKYGKGRSQAMATEGRKRAKKG